MEDTMKNLRKLAGISILCILIFMVIALLRFQQQESDFTLLPNQFEHDFNEDWEMATLEDREISWRDMAGDKIPEWDKYTLTKEFQNVKLPYIGSASNAGKTLVFKKMLPQDYAGLTMNFFSTDARV